MYLFENPVLQRELLVNLRMKRAFVLLLAYQAVLAIVVYLSWPSSQRIDLTDPSEAEAKQLIDTFFMGQFLLASMMAPSFAAGTITGEKERKTYEMLLASPMRPTAILLGKLLASLTHLAILVFSSLPIVMLCLPLGGVSVYEVLAAYLALLLSTVTFGVISVACSSYFQRTVAALLVSYLLILPLALLGILFWQSTSASLATYRLGASITVLPAGCALLWIALFRATSARLMHPPDVGSEGKDVMDEEQEMQQAVGLVIQRGQFPDNLFAPAKRTDLLEDGANPVFDKEMRSEIFSQGTLMLRVVIQVSMVLAIPLMFYCFYFREPENAPWYVSYVVLFNMLVGPVFSAGSVTSERERQTLDLLLTTTLTPWQILRAKLVSGLRVSSVLTMFLVWPLLLAAALVSQYWNNLWAMAWYVLIIATTCLTTATIALFCSVIFQKTSVALMTAYLAVVILFTAPVAASRFTGEITGAAGAAAEISVSVAEPAFWVDVGSIVSPFSAAFSVPLWIDGELARPQRMPVHLYSFAFYVVFNAALLMMMTRLFNSRWRIAQ